MSTQKLARSAVTGRIVSQDYAKSHPKTTVVETVRRAPAPAPKPSKK